MEIKSLVVVIFSEYLNPIQFYYPISIEHSVIEVLN
jgi:hypothetical protein